MLRPFVFFVPHGACLSLGALSAGCCTQSTRGWNCCITRIMYSDYLGDSTNGIPPTHVLSNMDISYQGTVGARGLWMRAKKCICPVPALTVENHPWPGTGIFLHWQTVKNPRAATFVNNPMPHLRTRPVDQTPLPKSSHINHPVV